MFGKERPNPLEYEQSYGNYWFVQDCLQKSLEGHMNFVLVPKSSDFRISHMTVKNLLFKELNMSKLSRRIIFPMYSKELQMITIDKQLSKRD